MRPASKHQRQGDLFAKRKRRARKGKKLGRPRNNPARAGSPHKRRPEHKKRFPVHVVLRVHKGVGSLRKRFMYRALREATIAVALRELAYDDVNGAFRIVHLSIQRTHVHLLVEADNRLALSRGMQSFQISAAKHINREYSVKAKLTERRRGNVFVDRFHQEVIKTPRQARRSLAYVLNNWRKHREDEYDFAKNWPIDPFSSAFSFDGWKEREDAIVRWPKRATYDPLIVYFPKTWLLLQGWQRHGLISFYEVPSRPGLPTA
ncbi:MAG TPA: transposase [Kofleriaceae bacterium]|jgi:REP element-mobilizing transposase RayT|nr:transposase [Kofleriaceae bacterium]